MERRRQRQLSLGFAGALIAAAVVKELRLPPGERSWHGDLAGLPYDLRPPTWERVKASWWNPAEPRLFTPRSFGVGWDLNLARLFDVGSR